MLGVAILIITPCHPRLRRESFVNLVLALNSKLDGLRTFLLAPDGNYFCHVGHRVDQNLDGMHGGSLDEHTALQVGCLRSPQQVCRSDVRGDPISQHDLCVKRLLRKVAAAIIDDACGRPFKAAPRLCAVTLR
jgi:hypothetical protein